MKLKTLREKVDAHKRLMVETDALLTASRALGEQQQRLIDLANKCIDKAREIEKTF